MRRKGTRKASSRNSARMPAGKQDASPGTRMVKNIPHGCGNHNAAPFARKVAALDTVGRAAGCRSFGQGVLRHRANLQDEDRWVSGAADEPFDDDSADLDSPLRKGLAHGRA